jgi:hypothetical protein
LKKPIKKLIQFIISFAILALILQWVDTAKLKQALLNTNIYYLFIAFILICFNRFLMPVKWNLLLRTKKINIGYISAIKIYFVSSFLGLYLPPTIGADAVRSFYVKQHGYDYSDTISSILVERLLGLIALLIFGIAGCLLFFNLANRIEFDLNRILLISIFSTLFISILFLLSLSPIFSRKVIRLFDNLSKFNILRKPSKLILSLYTSYVDFSNHKIILLIFFLLTWIEVCLPIIRSYIVALAFNVHVPLIYFFAFVPIILLLIRLPISIDGFGIHEGGYVYFLSLVGVASSDGFAIGLINHLIFLIGILPGGLIYLFQTNPAKSSATIAKIDRGQAI